MSLMNIGDESDLESVAPGSARQLRRALVSDALIDEVIAQAGDQGITLTGGWRPAAGAGEGCPGARAGGGTR